MIYFDAGATTLQKPERVRRAMYRAAAAMSSPGRGSYPATRLAEETDFRCRSLAAALFDVEDPACVVFTSSACSNSASMDSGRNSGASMTVSSTLGMPWRGRVTALCS